MSTESPRPEPAKSKRDAETEIPLLTAIEDTRPTERLSVHISYEIIKLFSEGLYKSPHKAIEELVANSYDAGASKVFILTPEGASDTLRKDQSLFVIDDGSGMDKDGFQNLWQVAQSQKSAVTAPEARRMPIGQFGIGKLAAYVLAWHLTHISKVENEYRFTSMDFKKLSGIHQYQSHEIPTIGLHVITEEKAKEILSEIQIRDPNAWEVLFGSEAARSWTVAALSEFRELYDKLAEGTLGWVLRSGLPLSGHFQVILNGDRLQSSKTDWEPLFEFQIGDENDEGDTIEGVTKVAGGVSIDGIDGVISGRAKVFKKQLPGGKSDQYHRSYGYFIRVRKRVINLEDALFGLPPLNHSAWARFYMEVDAEGLRDHLLSSREAVRDSTAIHILQKYLQKAFNTCRNHYEREIIRLARETDIAQLLSKPSVQLYEPMLDVAKEFIRNSERSFYYLDFPALPEGETEKTQWLTKFEADIQEYPVKEFDFKEGDPYGKIARFDVAKRKIIVNTAHPLIVQYMEYQRPSRSSQNILIKLLTSSEIFLEFLLADAGLAAAASDEIFRQRDMIFRIIAGDAEPTATDAIRKLGIANENWKALEAAIGTAFRIFGFTYEKRGGNSGGPDGILRAKLGVINGEVADITLVYEAKATDQSAVPADKIDILKQRTYVDTAGADFAFVVAKAFQGQDDLESQINKNVIKATKSGLPVTLITIGQLQQIVNIHIKHSISLERLRSLFESARTVAETQEWIDKTTRDLSNSPRVPWRLLLEKLEEAKVDDLEAPNISTVRSLSPDLKHFKPAVLMDELKKLQGLVGKEHIEIYSDSVGTYIYLKSTPDNIIHEAERKLRDDFGIEDQE